MKHAVLTVFLVCCMFSFSAYSQQEKEEQLWIAAYDGDESAIIELIKAGVNINAQNQDGVTALMYASQNGHLDIVKILLHNGADPNIVPNNGNTALHSACINNHEDVVLTLIQHNAKINLKNKQGITPLLYASFFGHYVVTHMLLFYHADVNQLAPDSSSALMAACYAGNQHVVSLLVNADTNINRQNMDGNTALHFAVERGLYQITDTLLKYHANPNILNKNNQTPLSIAINNNDQKMVELLLSSQKINTQNTKQTKADIDFAIRNDYSEITKILKKNGFTPSHKPYIGARIISINQLFNHHDYLGGFSYGILESRYNWLAEINYYFRPKYKKVIIPENDSIYFQYKETRFVYSISLSKYFSQQINKRWQVNYAVGAQCGITHGVYRAARKYYSDFIFSPNFKFSFNTKYVEYFSELHYLNFKRDFLPKLYYNAGIKFRINNPPPSKQKLQLNWI